MSALENKDSNISKGSESISSSPAPTDLQGSSKTNSAENSENPDNKNYKIFNFRVSGLDWWINDQTIAEKLSTVGEVVELVIIDNPISGKSRGVFECSLKCSDTEHEVINEVGAIKFGNEKETNVISITKVFGNNHHISFFDPSKWTIVPKPKPAQMLYEDSKNPIPKELLSHESANNRNDDIKKSKKQENNKNYNRNNNLSREREYYDDYDYDYSYSYSYKDRDRGRDREKDRRRRDDEDERERRRRDDRDDRYREKRRK